MKLKIKVVAICFLFMISLLPSQIFAVSGDVKVVLPKFKVQLNGVRVQNDYRQYPLIVYKDITYFPMTYHDCRFLGTETKWDNKSGLEISKTEVTAAYRDYKGSMRNGSAYTASVPNFPVKVNGKIVDNSGEEFPLLLFRNVTYFPMTWRFAVDEFGWKYRFDSNEGLVIESSNKKLEEVSLSGYGQGSLLVSDGYYYYGDPKGMICQAPIDSPDRVRKIYQLPMWSYGDSYVSYGLSEKEGKVWLSYHQGGAVMGADYYIKLNQDGTYEDVEAGYLTFKSFGDVTVMVNQGVPPGSNNLMLKYGKGEYKSVGDPAYLYGWAWEQTADSSGGSHSGDIYLKDDMIYILAFNRQSGTGMSMVHSVDISTNETTRISNLPTKAFKLEGESIYCESGGKLYKIPLGGGKAMELPTAGNASESIDIQVLEGNVYYASAQNGELYKAGVEQSLNPSGKVTAMKIDDGCLVCTFEEEISSLYRIMVLDKSGDIVFRTSDVAELSNVSVENGKVYYVENTSRNVYSAMLRD